MNSTATQLEANWLRLETICIDQLLTSYLDRNMSAAYTRMLNELRQDRSIDGHVALGMYRAPGSKDRHHNREGGLVAHLLEMWDIYMKMEPIIMGGSFSPGLLLNMSRQNVWRAILHHDLNKVWRYRIVYGSADDPNLWQVEYSKKDTATELLGSTNKSLWILQKYGIELTLPLYNALLTSEGGYAKTRPRVDTAFAKLLYVLDELSANVVNRLQTGRFWDSLEGGIREEA